MTLEFGAYARYYDAVYEDKDYTGECLRVEVLAERWGRPGPCRILDAGCGTGRHAAILAGRGHRVLGVDRSELMISLARKRAAGDLRFEVGDLRTLDVGQTFDVVTCLFGVVSYLLSTADILAALQTFRRHLDPGGLLVFDYWSGPAVLAVGPSTRVVRRPGLVRIAMPAGHDVATQTNTTDYTVIVLEGDRVVEEVHETHRVRYLFPQEVKHYLDDCGFDTVHLTSAWDSESPVDATSWIGVVVARARADR